MKKTIYTLGWLGITCCLVACSPKAIINENGEKLCTDIELTVQTENISSKESELPQMQPIQPEKVEISYNQYETLKVATYLTRIDGVYFINDCYHDQILYNDSLEPDLKKWKVLTSEVHYSHTVAGDGELLICDDTENDRVLVFEQDGLNFTLVQRLENIGMKPHFTYYDEKRDVFMTWSSITGEMYYFKKDINNRLYIDRIMQIQELFGVYVRSFSMIDDKLVFVSGHNNEKIIIANADTFEVEQTYKVPGQLAGMVQIIKEDAYYYVTVSTDNTENQSFATIVRTPSLQDLSEGKYEDIYDIFGIDKGTPYNITNIDGRFYMSHHGTSQNIIAFDIVDNNIENIDILY